MSGSENKNTLSIKSKLIRIQLLLAFLVLTPCTIAFLVNDILIFKRSVERNLESSANILGRNLAPAIAFGDKTEAEKILSSLQSEPSIKSAVVFDEQGKIFASYGTEGVAGPQIIPARRHQASVFKGGRLIFSYRFPDRGETLHLSADLKGFAIEYKGFVWVVLFVFMTGLILSFGIARWMQGSLSVPVVKLADTAKAISQAEDYSLRLDSAGTGAGIQEFETLSREFNRMLEHIQSRDQNIRHERDVAEKANKAKSVFLANMSHELRTPMHGVLSYARFGQQKIETASKEKLKSYFDEIHGSGERLMVLLNDLLDLAKLEAGKIAYSISEADFIETARAVISEMAAFGHEKGLKIELHSNFQRIDGKFDRDRVMQVIRNLLSNAVKFSTAGSQIEIVAGKTGTRLKCQVINQGVGVPAGELESIFDKFVQSSKTASGAGGTGLGLAICREIVNHHNGKIWAESAPNGKTIFTFELELAEVEAVVEPAGDPAA